MKIQKILIDKNSYYSLKPETRNVLELFAREWREDLYSVNIRIGKMFLDAALALENVIGKKGSWTQEQLEMTEEN